MSFLKISSVINLIYSRQQSEPLAPLLLQLDRPFGSDKHLIFASEVRSIPNLVGGPFEMLLPYQQRLAKSSK